MVQHEISRQTEAYDWLVKRDKYPEIIARARQKWDDDYVMVRHEYERQVEDYEWINKQTAYPAIMARAKQKWVMIM